MKDIEQIRLEKKRSGHEPMKDIDWNAITGLNCDFSRTEPMTEEEWKAISMKYSQPQSVQVDPPSVSIDSNATTGHSSNTRPVKHVWTDEEWEMFDSAFLEPAIMNDPAALAEYLAPRLEERKKPKKRQRIIYVDALCEEIETCPKKGRWDFDCLFP